MLSFAQGRPDVGFQVVERGVHSGENEAGLRVYRTERAFEEFAKEHGDDRVKRLVKNTDWNTDQLIVVFAGRQPSGGYSIDVKRIANIDVQRLQVEAKINKPRSDEMVTQALTTPYVIIRMQRQVAAIKVKFLTD